jgi:rRNA processing protein Gar1
MPQVHESKKKGESAVIAEQFLGTPLPGMTNIQDAGDVSIGEIKDIMGNTHRVKQTDYVIYQESRPGHEPKGYALSQSKFISTYKSALF